MNRQKLRTWLSFFGFLFYISVLWKCLDKAFTGPGFPREIFVSVAFPWGENLLWKVSHCAKSIEGGGEVGYYTVYIISLFVSLYVI